MKLQLKQLFEIVGEKKEIDYSITLDELSSYNIAKFHSPVHINGVACNRAGIVTIKYKVTAVLEHLCDRCLSEFNREYVYDFEHILVQKSNVDDDRVVCEDDTLDLNELAISDLLLQLPSKILCKEDCKGLCFVCGQNLNEASCECEKS